jgi:hypothetical protein
MMALSNSFDGPPRYPVIRNLKEERYLLPEKPFGIILKVILPMEYSNYEV